jgi:hypothetical protein
MGASCSISQGVFITYLEGFVAVIIEEKVVNHKSDLGGDSHKGRQLVCHVVEFEAPNGVVEERCLLQRWRRLARC